MLWTNQSRRNSPQINAKLDTIIRHLIARQPGRVDDLVGVEYIMERTGYSYGTVIQGKAGTNAIPHNHGRPRKYRRGDVDKWLRERAVRSNKPDVRLLRRGKR